MSPEEKEQLIALAFGPNKGKRVALMLFIAGMAAMEDYNEETHKVMVNQLASLIENPPPGEFPLLGREQIITALAEFFEITSKVFKTLLDEDLRKN